MIFLIRGGDAFSIDGRNNSDRRSFLSNVVSTSTASATAAAGLMSFVGAGLSMPAVAAPEIFTLKSGIKYAITKPSEKDQYPQVGDIVAVEYTGYLVNGQVSEVIGCSNIYKVGVLYNTIFQLHASCFNYMNE
jgi:FKBP-type peptidyl-prolyl cis-trans isomerases 1